MQKLKLQVKIQKFKNLFIFLIIASLVFPFELNKTEAASTTLSKTVEFFAGQDSSVRTDGNQFSFSFTNVIIPETNPIIKSAVIEINGISYNSLGDQKINVDLQQGSAAAEAGIDYILAGTTKPKPFTIKYDAWQAGAGAMGNIIAAGAYDYTLYLKNTSDGGTVSFSIASAKLILTYSYSSSSFNLLKTNKFFIVQETGNTLSGDAVSKDFAFIIPEQTPAIESVFVEASGIAKGSGTGTIDISVVDQGASANYSYPVSIDLGGGTNITKFTVRYDASSSILSSSFPGSKNYTLYLRGTGFSTNLWNAKLIVTYKYSENTGGLPISGYVISSTFDTWQDAAKAKGAAYNSIMWKGNLNGGKVRLQLATSNSSLGPWIFKGPDCSSATYYEPAADTPSEIMCATDAEHNNKQYFRYKIILCSNDCIAAGNNNPEVTGVVVNWAE